MTISSAPSLDYGASTNILTNGGAETNTTGWGAVNGAGTVAIARTTAEKFEGAASLEITVTTGQQNGSRIETYLTVTAGVTYTLSVRVKPSQNAAWTLRVIGLNGGMGTVLSAASSGTAWQQMPLTFSTGTTTSIRIDLNVNVAGLTGVSYLDAGQVELGSVATPYIHTDGGTASRAATAILLPTASLNGNRGHLG